MNTTTMQTAGTYTDTAPRKTDLTDILANISIVCAFLPLVTTFAWLIYAIPNLPIWITDYILFPMMVIGWIATLLSCPLKLLKLLGKMAGKPFLAGLLFPLIPVNFIVAACCLAAGLVAFLALLAFAPAVVSLIYFFKSE